MTGPIPPFNQLLRRKNSMFRKIFVKTVPILFSLALTASCTSPVILAEPMSSTTTQIIDVENGDFLNECATPRKLDIKNDTSINALQNLKFLDILQPYYFDKDLGHVKHYPALKYTFKNRIYTNQTKRVNIRGTKVPLSKITYTDTLTGESGILELPEEIVSISTIIDSVRLGDIIYFLAYHQPEKDSYDLTKALWSFHLPTEQLNIHIDDNLNLEFVSERLRIVSGNIYLQGWNNNLHFLYTLNTNNNTWEGVNLGRARSFKIGRHAHEIIFHRDKFYSVGVTPNSYPAVLRLLEFDPATGITTDLTPLPQQTSVSGRATYITATDSSIVWFDQNNTMYQYDTDSKQLKEIRQVLEQLPPRPLVSTNNYMIYQIGMGKKPDKRSRKSIELYALNLNTHQLQALSLSDVFADAIISSTNLSPIFVTDDTVLLTTRSLSRESELWTIELDCIE